MQVKADTHLAAQFGAGLQCSLRKGERGVQAKSGADPVVALALAGLGMPNEASVFGDAGTSRIFSIPVGDLVAEAGAHTRLFHRSGDLVQAPGDMLLAGVMVDECCGAMADGVHQTHQRAGVHVVRPQGLVQPPPQLLEDLREVGRWFTP